MNFFYLTLCMLLVLEFGDAKKANKYSADANKKPAETSEDMDFRPVSLKHLDKPFRMAKLNLLWSKAVIRLSEPKLKSLFEQLKLHDKEEITWKHLKAEGKDKEGLKEAELRKKLTAIMENYDLAEHVDHVHNPDNYGRHKPLNEGATQKLNKNLFKDKKLNKLWERAETAGFTTDELEALKEEFEHHEEKVDQYYSLLHDVKGKGATEDSDANSVDDQHDKINEIQTKEDEPENKDYTHKANQLRDQHKEIKESLDRLSLLASKGPSSKEFVEPKVQGLWKIALESNFTPDELQSLKTELLHYENRLLKLRHLRAELAINEEKYKRKKIDMAGGKTDAMMLMEDSIKKHNQKVDKLHLHLESKIMQRHLEL